MREREEMGENWTRGGRGRGRRRQRDIGGLVGVEGEGGGREKGGGDRERRKERGMCEWMLGKYKNMLCN